jgi:hypothetical protein
MPLMSTKTLSSVLCGNTATRTDYFKAIRLPRVHRGCNRRVSIDSCPDWLVILKVMGYQSAKPRAPMKSRFLLTRAGDACFFRPR